MNKNDSQPGLRPPPKRGLQDRAQSFTSQRSTSSLSTISNDSQTAAQTAAKRNAVSPAPPTTLPPRPSTAGSFGPTTSRANFSRPAPLRHDDSLRMQRSNAMSSMTGLGHRRQHSQGFFEPSLPTASASNMSASAIAAAAAMNHLGPPTPQVHERKRSISGLSSLNVLSPPSTSHARGAISPQRQSPPSGFVASPEESRTAAANAAAAAFPKSPGAISTLPTVDTSYPLPPLPALVPEKEQKTKEKSKMKLFSKPKNIHVSKDNDKKLPTLPSPAKNLPSMFPNMSTTSLIDSSTSGTNSMYSSANASTSTLQPIVTTSMGPPPPPSSDKHRPSFLSRQKLRHGDKILPLSSASSNSQAVDPSAPNSLYSFVPQSPGPNSTFSKSVTGLDLRHGGKGLRDRRKEEKAAASLGVAMPGSSLNVSSDHRSDFLGPSSLESSFLGPQSATTPTNVFQFDHNPSASAAAFNNLGNVMGLSGITPDDAWPLLKARLLNVFEGEDVRTPVEDFNLLVSVHVRRCVQKRAPHVLIEDLREFLQTGFASLMQTLRSLADDRLVPSLVELWQMVYCKVLPFVQAVFLPLDLEFRGHGPVMTAREAQDFWGAMPEMPPPSASNSLTRQSSELTRPLISSEELDVRRLTLTCFRDSVLIPRHDSLLMTFSRLSLDALRDPPSAEVTSRSRGTSNPVERPLTTAGSLSPRLSSYSSQTSTLADSPVSGSAFAQGRSRATSGASAGSFGTSLPHLPSPLAGNHARTRSSTASAAVQPHPPAPENITSAQGAGDVADTVARMLQCVSVLAALHTGDLGQQKVELLTAALKHNWLGRGRMGRQRNGFVGTRVATVVGA